jgi:hypothetical protein
MRVIAVTQYFLVPEDDTITNEDIQTHFEAMSDASQEIMDSKGNAHYFETSDQLRVKVEEIKRA